MNECVPAGVRSLCKMVSGGRKPKLSRGQQRYQLLKRQQAVGRLRSSARRGNPAARRSVAKIRGGAWKNLRRLYWQLVYRSRLRGKAKKIRSKRRSFKRQVYPRSWGAGVFY